MALPTSWNDYYKLLHLSLDAQSAANDKLDAILVALGGGGGGPASQTIESGTVATSYGSASAVAPGAVTVLTSYAALGPTRMKIVEVSGTNIATYTIKVNGTVVNKKQTFYGYLDNKFDFSKGFEMAAGDVATVEVMHQQSSPGDFNAFILVLKDY